MTVRLESAEVALLRASVADHRPLRIVVNACAYSCCGRGWRRRDGYLQEYVGYIDNLTEPDEARGIVRTFMLYSVGLGTISYVVAVRDFEVELVEEPC